MKPNTASSSRSRSRRARRAPAKRRQSIPRVDARDPGPAVDVLRRAYELDWGAVNYAFAEITGLAGEPFDFRNWPRASIVELLETFLRLAPSEDFAESMAGAERERVDLERMALDFEREDRERQELELAASKPDTSAPPVAADEVLDLYGAAFAYTRILDTAGAGPDPQRIPAAVETLKRAARRFAAAELAAGGAA